MNEFEQYASLGWMFGIMKEEDGTASVVRARTDGSGKPRRLYLCRNPFDAGRLAAHLNAGDPMCKGCKSFGNNCGKCPKCELTI